MLICCLMLPFSYLVAPALLLQLGMAGFGAGLSWAGAVVRWG